VLSFCAKLTVRWSSPFPYPVWLAAAATHLQQYTATTSLPFSPRFPSRSLLRQAHYFACCVHLRRHRCCRPYAPFRIVHSWSAPCASRCPRARCTSATRCNEPSPRTLTPTLTLTLDPNPSPYEPLPPRGTAIVSTVGFALPLAAAPSAACRYPDATATGQPSGRSPP
jgi:hypothetical protein